MPDFAKVEKFFTFKNSMKFEEHHFFPINVL